jgi:gas vesicle protein
MNEYSYPNNDPARGANVVMGFVLGAVVGAGIALLLAPATGVETRNRIGDAAKKLRQNAGQTVDRARSAVSDLKDDARHAIDAGRESFRRGAPSTPTMTETGRTT